MPARFAEVIPGVYRGGEPSMLDLQTLKNTFGVKVIVSLDQEIADKIAPIVKSLGMRQIVINIGHGDLVSQIKQLTDNLTDIFSIKPMYIHCLHGRDRTGLAIALFRVANGWSASMALKEAYSFGFGDGLSPKEEVICVRAIRQSDISPVNLDIVELERQTHDPMSTETGRHQFDPGVNPVENDLVSGEDRIDTQFVDDVNCNMAQIGGFENNNPILRGLGPIEPFGVYPLGYTLLY